MFASATACFFCPVCLFSEENSFYHLQYLLKLANSSPEDAGPIDRIFFKHGLVYCTGRSELAVENNRAAEKMAGGDFRQAADILEKALRNSALFFPFRYNMGTCCLHLGDLRKSLLHFKKAQAVVPEYAGTYLQIGDIYLRMNRDNDAIDNYRAALKRNKKELNAYVLLGDLFFNRNQLQIAKKYYDGCLDIDPRFPNGLLGRAKIHFKLGRYYQALLLLKSIDTTVEYDKALHYYFAECAFKLRDYATASRQYGLLLQHKNDKFFLTSPVSLIERKLELSRRFIEK
jgi:tetratricopeptide (TPR) repeat protein